MSILARVFNTAVFSNNSAFDITPNAFWFRGNVKNDVGYQYVIEQVSLSFKGLPNMNGNQPSVGFTIKGNFYVNQDLIKIPIKK